MINFSKDFQEVACSMCTPMKDTPDKLNHIGLSTSKVLITPKGFTKYTISALIGLLNLETDDNERFKKSVTSYLSLIGTRNKGIFEKVTDIGFYPTPTSPEEKTHLTFLTWMVFVQIAKITETVWFNNFFLQDPSKIFLLVDWHKKMVNITTREATATTNGEPVTGAQKYPSFELKNIQHLMMILILTMKLLNMISPIKSWFFSSR